MTTNFVEIFTSIVAEPVRDRVDWLRELRDMYPDERGKVLAWACANMPDKVEELINTTSLIPRVVSYGGAAFDHELENFVFCFTEAGIEKYPRLVKALWNKLMNESPEPIIARDPGMKFLIEFINHHPKYEDLLNFTMRELFGRIVPGRVDPKDVIPLLRVVNGLYPKLILDTIEGLNEIEKERRFNGVTKVHKDKLRENVYSVLESKFPVDNLGKNYLSLDESRRLVDKINELFFS